MAIELNHTIVNSRDKNVAAAFLAELFDLPAPKPFAGWFMAVQVGRLTLDYCDTGDDPLQIQHYAFLVDEADFDRIFGKIQARGLPYWADPGQQRAGEINRHDGGRGLYFEDPSGHLLEIITRPYGG
jgi:catechol 2,3-dioxygenase-like lactoylglutathione lyase family enzyme